MANGHRPAGDGVAMTEATRLEAITRRYPVAGGAGRFELSSTTLEIEAGSWTVITGPSGAGKTTLLQIIAGLDEPDAGRRWILGREVGPDAESTLALLRRERLGIIYQHDVFLEHLPVWENVSCRLVPAGVPARERRERARATLTELGLAGAADARPDVLSGGERQRVAVARALVGNPDLIIADEPTSQVDRETGALVVQALRRRHTAGTTVVLATHDPALMDAADRHLRLHAGGLADPGVTGAGS
ncbi:MAG: ATP-binding cassette domain-containing protein [Phycisphaerales bacterium]|nr:ATP-binding cassette domain-containing protein [Phycisphaerae bacterium]NNM26743.1 ATP-binding cassette domain-containing protein [Phycisphaerales bacterium]